MSTPLAYMLNWKINDKSRGKLVMWFQWFRGYRLWPNNPVITNFASLSSKLWPTYILTRCLILTIKTAPPHMIAPNPAVPTYIQGGVVTIGNLFVKFTKLLEGDKFYCLSMFGTDKNISFVLQVCGHYWALKCVFIPSKRVLGDDLRTHNGLGGLLGVRGVLLQLQSEPGWSPGELHNGLSSNCKVLEATVRR